MVRDLALQWSMEPWSEEKWEKFEDRKMEEAEKVEAEDKKVGEAEKVEAEDKKVQEEDNKVEGGEKKVKLPEVEDEDMKVEDEDTKMEEGEELVVGAKVLKNGLQNAAMSWDSFSLMKLPEVKNLEPECMEQHLLKLQILERDQEVKALMRKQSQEHFDWLQQKMKLLH